MWFGVACFELHIKSHCVHGIRVCGLWMESVPWILSVCFYHPVSRPPSSSAQFSAGARGPREHTRRGFRLSSHLSPSCMLSTFTFQHLLSQMENLMPARFLCFLYILFFLSGSWYSFFCNWSTRFYFLIFLWGIQKSFFSRATSVSLMSFPLSSGCVFDLYSNLFPSLLFPCVSPRPISFSSPLRIWGKCSIHSSLLCLLALLWSFSFWRVE